jgi:hypothetical protein
MLSIIDASPVLGQKSRFLSSRAVRLARVSLRLRENDALEPVLVPLVLAADVGEGAEPGRLRNNNGVGGDSVETSRPPEPPQSNPWLQLLQTLLPTGTPTDYQV